MSILSSSGALSSVLLCRGDPFERGNEMRPEPIRILHHGKVPEVGHDLHGRSRNQCAQPPRVFGWRRVIVRSCKKCDRTPRAVDPRGYDGPVELFAVEGEIARVHPEPALAVDPGRGPTRLVGGRRAHQPANVTGIVRGGVHSRMQEKWAQAPPRGSEEHTSELQSRETISYAVFCLKK